jgi:hypothetical protein
MLRRADGRWHDDTTNTTAASVRTRTGLIAEGAKALRAPIDHGA